MGVATWASMSRISRMLTKPATVRKVALIIRKLNFSFG
jgi:hypothetical protein